MEFLLGVFVGAVGYYLYTRGTFQTMWNYLRNK